jgi:NAD(P)-dependent dehydrogenase (short-subunit alcohol dehydrogenase family)
VELMDLDLHGRTAIVTGGSQGIGRGVARELAREGASVVIAARHRGGLEQTAAELRDETGADVRAIVADHTDAGSVRELVAETIAAHGRIDALVNNASNTGGSSTGVGAADVDPLAVAHDFDAKTLGYLRCAQAVAPHMIEAGYGRIVNIAGLSARLTGAVSTSMRQAAIHALTKSLADELGPKGIAVTTVHPGATRTEAVAAMVELVSPDARPAVEARFAAMSTYGRVIEVQEVAWVVAFLSSPRSIAINGEAIATGGGHPGSIHY